MGAPVLLLLVLAALALFTACRKGDHVLKGGFEAGRYRTVLAFGDSIVAGYGQPEGWPEILNRLLREKYGDVTVINAGVPGDTAADGLARLQRDVLDRGPDLVLIAFGLNDMKEGRSVDSYAADLSLMTERISEAGSTPVLLTTTRLQRGAAMVIRADPGPYNEAVRRIAAQKTVPLIDVFKSFGGYNTTAYLTDIAHPNAAGYRILAGVVREGLVGE